MLSENFMKLEMKCKREDFDYDIFDVSISYYGGMFRIDIIGGWDQDAGVPEYGFGTSFGGGKAYYGGLYEAIRVTLNGIRTSKETLYVKNIAESALARACLEFQLKHNGMF